MFLRRRLFKIEPKSGKFHQAFIYLNYIIRYEIFQFGTEHLVQIMLLPIFHLIDVPRG